MSTESDYLTALAAQERRVLELKEELQKAEAQLQTLKKQWANHESTKRRDERQKVHQMKPMTASPKVRSDEDEDGSNAWMYEEMARRKALLSNTKTSHRRVFSGSRQTKTLSLLESIEGEDGEPASASDTPSARSPMKASPRIREVRRSRELVKTVPGPGPGPARASTTPNLWQTGDFTIDPIAWARADSRSPQREAIIRTGKQVATDLREGLWTFLEDLRQVAIGEEPRPAQPQQDGLEGQSSKRSGRSGRPSMSPRTGSERTSRKPGISPTEGEKFIRDNDLPAPTLIEAPEIVRPARSTGATPQKSRKSRNPIVSEPTPDAESWETWDSPPPAQPRLSHSPTSTASPTASSIASTPGTMISDNNLILNSADSTPKPLPLAAKRDAIPWPSLSKLGPPAAAMGGQLRKTASHLMQEWERSLSPSPVESPNGAVEERRQVSGGLDWLP